MSDKIDEATTEEEVTSEIKEMMEAMGQPTGESEKPEDAKEDDSEEGTASEDVEKEKEEDEKEEIDDEQEAEKEEAAEGEEDEEDPDEKSSPEKVAGDPDERDQVIVELREKLAEKESAIEKVSEKEKEDEKEDETELTFEEQDFLGDLDIDDVMESKDSLNKLLQIVYTKGITETRKVLGEHVLREIPSIVQSNIAIMEELAKTRKEFYEENPDLEPFKKVVATVFEEVAAESPDKNAKELLEEVGKEARKRLELHKDVTSTKSEKKPPKLPEKKTSRTSKDKPDVSGLETELSDMNKVIRR